MNANTIPAGTVTFIARIPGGTGYVTRTSESMRYSHAVIVGTEALSWHLTEAAARKAASSTRYSNAKVVPVEWRQGGKAKVERQLNAEKPETNRERLSREAKERVAKKAPSAGVQISPAALAEALGQAAEKLEKAPSVKKAAPAKQAAGTRAIPAEAANKARQAWIDANGIEAYRKQYNGGWDSATYGQGVKKAASGEASVAWMDGYTDRIANPGKEGIKNKWVSLRSTVPPVASWTGPAKKA